MAHFTTTQIILASAFTGVVVGLLGHAVLDSFGAKFPASNALIPGAAIGTIAGGVAIALRDVDRVVMVDITTREEKQRRRLEEAAIKMAARTTSIASAPSFYSETPMGIVPGFFVKDEAPLDPCPLVIDRISPESIQPQVEASTPSASMADNSILPDAINLDGSGGNDEEEDYWVMSETVPSSTYIKKVDELAVFTKSSSSRPQSSKNPFEGLI
jgi:hypothetical protein